MFSTSTAAWCRHLAALWGALFWWFLPGPWEVKYFPLVWGCFRTGKISPFQNYGKRTPGKECSNAWSSLEISFHAPRPKTLAKYSHGFAQDWQGLEGGVHYAGSRHVVQFTQPPPAFPQEQSLIPFHSPIAQLSSVTSMSPTPCSPQPWDKDPLWGHKATRTPVVRAGPVAWSSSASLCALPPWPDMGVQRSSLQVTRVAMPRETTMTMRRRKRMAELYWDPNTERVQTWKMGVRNFLCWFKAKHAQSLG